MTKDKKMTLLLFAGVILILIAIGGVYYYMFQRANPPLTMTQAKIGGVTFNVELALTMTERTRGLSYRASLGSDNGMLFVFSTSTVQTFWMKDMNFPLDMIWIGGGKVLGFEQNAPQPAPGTALYQLPIYSSPDGTNEVLEVNAGTVAKYNIKVGDAVQVVI